MAEGNWNSHGGNRPPPQNWGSLWRKCSFVHDDGTKLFRLLCRDTFYSTACITVCCKVVKEDIQVHKLMNQAQEL